MSESTILESEGYRRFRENKRQKSCFAAVLFLLSLTMITMAIFIWVDIFSISISMIILGGVILFASILIPMYYQSCYDIMIKGIEVLSRLKEPKIDWEQGFVLIVVDDVYVFTRMGSNLIYFVAFRGTPQKVDETSIDVPRLFYMSVSKIAVGKHRLLRKEGRYRVPSPDGGFMEGDGVVYSYPVIASMLDWIPPDYTKEELMEIIEAINQDTSIA